MQVFLIQHSKKPLQKTILEKLFNQLILVFGLEKVPLKFSHDMMRGTLLSQYSFGFSDVKNQDCFSTK